MGASDWPTWWVVLAPAMMLAVMAVCMMSTRCMMGGTRERPDAHSAGGASGADPARMGSYVPARFPDGQAGFENLATAKDKVEFDKFVVERKRSAPPAA
jgi:hypothetical protein